MILYIQEDGKTTMTKIGNVSNIQYEGRIDSSYRDFKISTDVSGGWGYVGTTSVVGNIPTKKSTVSLPKIKDVRYYDNKVTVVWFDDDEPPVRVVCKDGDVFSEELGLSMAIAKKYFGSYDRLRFSVYRAKRFEGKKRVKKNGKV